MKKTPFYSQHQSLGAKIVPFAGWDMPLSYRGVLDEHRSVRQGIGLFDVSHMGRIEVRGAESVKLLDRIATSAVRDLPIGRMQYALFCNEDGGILDDIMIYRIEDRRYLVCANASNADKIDRWIQQQAALMDGVEVENITGRLAQLAIQGPKSRDFLKKMTDLDLDSFKMRHCLETKVAGVPMLLSRSGYTGELGYELYLPSDQGQELWEALTKGDSGGEAKPCGLGCRDTLRLEMGYPLYGNDMDEATTPIEASLEFAVDLNKGDFIGAKKLFDQQEKGVSRKRIGFELEERGVPRHGYKILSEGNEIGVVCSGNHSPSMNKGIGMAYVPPEYSEVGRTIEIQLRDRLVAAKVVKMPFYKKNK